MKLTTTKLRFTTYSLLPSAPIELPRIKWTLCLLAIFSVCSAVPKADAALFVRDSKTSFQGPCLDVFGAIDTFGTPVENYICNGTVAQQWNFEGLQIQGTGSNGSTGFNCLWSTGGIGSPVVLAPCGYTHTGWSNQWYYYNYSIYNLLNGLCLDGNGPPATQATLQKCNGTPAQTWSIRS